MDASTPEQLYRQAQQLTRELRGQPLMKRAQALWELRQTNEVLFSLVATALDEDLFSPLVMCGKPRSSQWRAVEADFLDKHPRCAACGSDELLQAHHLVPYHQRPDLELEVGNLLPLCMKYRCHLTIGHLCSWQSINKHAITDAAAFLQKVKRRP